MIENPNQPREYDAVLGGQTPPPVGGVVLGGLEGVKRRLASPIVEQQIAALFEALKYGEAGLDLVIQALQDESERVGKAAYQLLRDRTSPQVKQALNSYNPYKFFEYLRTFKAHSRQINSVAISPDGQTLVSGSRDKTIKVWNLKTGELLRTLQQHRRDVQSVAISPDGQTLVSGSVDMTIKIWHLPTGEEIRTLRGHSGAVTSVAISPDGQTAFSGSMDGTVKLWNLQTGQEIRTLGESPSFVGTIYESRGAPVWSIAISPDGLLLISGSPETAYHAAIKVWNLQTGQLLHTLCWGLTSVGWSVAISPDGQTLVSGTPDKTIKVWNLQNCKLVRTFGEFSNFATSAAISPSGQILMGSNRDKIIVWDLNTGEQICTLTGHSGHVNSVVFSLDGQVLVSVRNETTIEVWGVR